MESSICLLVCYGHKKSVLWWKTASMWVIKYSNPVIYPKDLYIEIFTGKRELERNIRERGIFKWGNSKPATKSSFTKWTRDESDGKRLAVPRKHGELAERERIWTILVFGRPFTFLFDFQIVCEAFRSAKVQREQSAGFIFVALRVRRESCNVEISWN